MKVKIVQVSAVDKLFGYAVAEDGDVWVFKRPYIGIPYSWHRLRNQAGEPESSVSEKTGTEDPNSS